MAARNLIMAAAGAAPQIQYVGGNSAAVGVGGSISLTSLTGGISTSPSQGDLVVVYLGVGNTSGTNAAPVVTTAGFKRLQRLTANSTYDACLHVSYKLMGVTPDTLIVFGGISSVEAAAAVVHVFRGVNQTYPIDAFQTAINNASALCNPPSITPITPGAVIVAGGATAHTQGVGRTFSTTDLDGFRTVGVGDDTDVTIGVGYKVWSGGAFDPAQFSFTGSEGTSNSWAAISLAICPAGSNDEKLTFVASASRQNTATGSSLVINRPTGTQQGDLMVAFMALSNDTTARSWTGDTGWTEVADYTNSSYGTPRIAYKIAGASEPSSYTFTASTTSRTLSGSILTFRGAAYDTVGSFATGVDAALPSLATVDRRAIVLGFGVVPGASLTITADSRMTTLVTDGDSTSPSYAIASERAQYGIIYSDGTTERGSRSFSNAGSNIVGILVSIKEV